MNGGANRLEVCANLGVGGGTTPSLGLVKCIEQVCKKNMNIMVCFLVCISLSIFLICLKVMIRPRIGDFVYTENEIDVMIADIEQFAKCHIQGVVFGALCTDGTIDVRLTRKLASIAADCGLQGSVRFA